ncbi:MAG: hypothetical protein U0441_25620 [Polyangiaceae bacterium]
MAKLILSSILVATLLLPLWTSSDPNPRRGLQKTVVGTILVTTAYLFATVVLYNRL